MRVEKLIYMANQIGDFFQHQKEEEAIKHIAEHMKSFWERRMLAQMFEHLDAGGQGLHDRVKKAVAALHHVH